MRISVITTGINDVRRAIKNAAKQRRFAAAVALTRTARQAAEDQKRQAVKELDRPTPFTLRGFRYKKATKKTLQSSVYIAPIQAEYLRWAVDGGRRPKRAKSGEALPVNISINRFGNIPGRSKGNIKKLIQRPDTFAGTVRGVYGLWQRGRESRSGRFSASGVSRKRNVQSDSLKLLVRFEPDTQYKKRLRFYRTADQTFFRHYDREFNSALQRALRTAR